METEGRRKLPFDSYGGSMRKLNFYTIDLAYVSYLKQAEMVKRGFSRVPNMEYGKVRKQKFLCGVVLSVSDVEYYVPVLYPFRTQRSGPEWIQFMLFLYISLQFLTFSLPFDLRSCCAIFPQKKETKGKLSDGN